MKIHDKALIFILVFALCGTVAAVDAEAGGRKRRERTYQETWCNAHHGIMEYTFSDRTRCDCLTDRYAVEVDFARKWREAIRQSLHYAEMSGKQAGIVLILETQCDTSSYNSLMDYIKRNGYDITVWKIKAK